MNPYLIIGIIGAILFSSVSGGAIGWHERALRVPAELAAQSDTDAKECRKAQQLTKDTNDALQKERDHIRAQLDAFKLRAPSTCLHPSSGAHVPAGGAGHAGADGAGVSTDWLRDYAASAEEYRTELSACSNFLSQERQLLAPTQE